MRILFCKLRLMQHLILLYLVKNSDTDHIIRAVFATILKKIID